MSLLPVSSIDAAFWPKLARGALSLGVSPISLALVMLSESGISPAARNPRDESKPPVAVGINQFLSVPGGTFFNYVKGMSPDEYRRLSASQQLDFALRFFADQYRNHPAAKKGGARDLYWLNFLPATYVSNAPDSHILAPDPAFGLGANIVKQNMGLVLPGESEFRSGVPVIRAAGLKMALDRAASQSSTRWGATVKNLISLGGKLEPTIPSFTPNLFTVGGSTIVGMGLVYAIYYFTKGKGRRT